jgi:UPF0755 protein
MTKKRSWLQIAVITFMALFVLAGAYLGWYWHHPLHPGQELFDLRPGMTVRAFARELTARGVLPEARTFALIATLTGRARAIKAGEYRFDDGISAVDLLRQIVAGRVVEYPFVLVEGWNFRQVMAALAQTPKIEHTLAGLTPAQIMERLGHGGEHWEGRFYPDTYSYSSGHSDALILGRAYERMQAILQQEWDRRDPAVPYRDPYQALILASIVEKETGMGQERPQIAAVFLNRLQRGMRLQTDPTVIYGLGEKFDGNLRLVDLRRDGPYNTYTRTGLPPTPIAMPGAAALRAVFHPAETRALYFVARGDGSHVFSDTLIEHNKAVTQYQLGGKPRPFSSNPATTTR